MMLFVVGCVLVGCLLLCMLLFDGRRCSPLSAACRLFLGAGCRMLVVAADVQA